MKTILCFDIGLKRTGMAVGQTISRTAETAGQIRGNNGQLDWTELNKAISKWQPNVIVIGDPKTDDTHLNKLINRFKSYIQQNHKLPIFEVDEKLTSSSANAELHDSGFSIKKKTELRDQIAACLILESYFRQL